MHAREHRPARAAHHLRRLGGRQAAQVHQRHRHPLLLGQPPHGTLHRFGSKPSQRFSGDVGRSRSLQARLGIQHLIDAPAPSSHLGACEVQTYRCHPRLDVVGTSMLYPRLVGVQVRLLDQILGRSLVAEEPPREIVHQVHGSEGRLEELFAVHASLPTWKDASQIPLIAITRAGRASLIAGRPGVWPTEVQLPVVKRVLRAGLPYVQRASRLLLSAAGTYPLAREINMPRPGAPVWLRDLEHVSLPAILVPLVALIAAGLALRSHPHADRVRMEARSSSDAVVPVDVPVPSAVWTSDRRIHAPILQREADNRGEP